MKRLTYEFPSTLAAHDIMEDWAMISCDPAVFFDVIALARSHNVLHMLPMAYYGCCTLFDLPNILRGEHRRDGSLATISLSDSNICILGREELIKQQAEETFAWMHTCDTSKSLEFYCRSVKSCAAARKDLLCRCFLPKPTIFGLQEWREEWEEGMCKSCVVLSKKLHDEGRERMWDNLPSIFGLLGWPELLNY